MEGLRHVCFAFVGTLLLGSLLSAQRASSTTPTTVPRFVNFSGHIVFAPGKRADAIQGITFSVYREQDGGAPLWMETQNVTIDARGNYTAQLGATESEGLPLELFNTPESRWLGVRVSGQEEQPRVLLLSVPYALKAADSETLGGLPASAFMLATPIAPGASSANSSSPANSSAAVPPPATVTGSGTADFLPMWTGTSTVGNSMLFQSGTGTTAKVGVNTTTPAATLDVRGSATVRGSLTLPATGQASATAGKNSQPQTFVTSSFSSNTATAVNQTFRWQAESAGNNTANPGGSLNLLFGLGNNTPAETGLKFANSGHITFAPGQTFPGTVKSVALAAPTSDFTVSGSPVTGSGTLALDWTIAPTQNLIANSIVKRDAAGSFTANAVGLNSLVAANSLSDAYTVAITGQSLAAGAGPTYGVYGTSTTSQGAGVVGRSDNTSSGYGVLGLVNNSSPAVAGFNYKSGGGIGVLGAGDWGFYTDNNVHQGLGGNGWVKAIIVYDDVYKKTMLRCFNSTLSGAAATTPPCGFTTVYSGTGNYYVEFGFDVSNRFILATASSGGSSGAAVANTYQDNVDAGRVYVFLWGLQVGTWVDGIFSVYVF